MPESTIDQVTEAKQELEQEILSKVEAFEEEHGVSVDYIDIVQADEIGRSLPKVTHVNIDLKL